MRLRVVADWQIKHVNDTYSGICLFGVRFAYRAFFFGGNPVGIFPLNKKY